jgi:hypothetical protein
MQAIEPIPAHVPAVPIQSGDIEGISSTSLGSSFANLLFSPWLMITSVPFFSWEMAKHGLVPKRGN